MQTTFTELEITSEVVIGEIVLVTSKELETTLAEDGERIVLEILKVRGTISAVVGGWAIPATFREPERTSAADIDKIAQAISKEPEIILVADGEKTVLETYKVPEAILEKGGAQDSENYLERAT